MLKRIRMEASRKAGSKIMVIFPDSSTRKATILTIHGGGPIKVWGDTEYVWIETTDKLVIDGEEVA